MAERRMFSKKIVNSDPFTEMELSAQALYFHLSMNADDDGFVNNPKMIQRMVGATNADMEELVKKRFILCFESGLVVIKHWKMNNYIQSDRYRPTQYQEEMSKLFIKKNKAYSLHPEQNIEISTADTECIQNVSTLDTQYSIGKESIDKDRLEKDSIDYYSLPIEERIRIALEKE